MTVNSCTPWVGSVEPATPEPPPPLPIPRRPKPEASQARGVPSQRRPKPEAPAQTKASQASAYVTPLISVLQRIPPVSATPSANCSLSTVGMGGISASDRYTPNGTRQHGTHVNCHICHRCNDALLTTQVAMGTDLQTCLGIPHNVFS